MATYLPRPIAALLIGLILPIVSTTSTAAPSFPKLSGRVVDTAGMLSKGTEAEINALAEGHEQATGNQIVVATVKDLQGYDIADYGYQLGRHWQIGQKDKNNGVLLLLAKSERKVRIEVGYGLEGQLTDAISSNIVNAVMLPQFRKGQFEAGMLAGTQSIVQALGGEYKMRSGGRSSKGSRSDVGGFALFIVIMLFQFFGGMGGGRRRRRGLFFLPLGMGSSRSGGGFGGGFSGGGGSFGGGGASGGW